MIAVVVRFGEVHRGHCCTHAVTPWIRALAFVLPLLACSGCGPGDPLEGKVDASTPIALSMWKASALARLPVEQQGDFDEAFQEIKFEIMGTGQAQGSEAIEAEAMGKVDGQTIRAVLGSGLGRKLWRLEAERAHRIKSVRYNEGIQTRPDDTRSQRYLAELHERQVLELQDEAAAIDRLKIRLRADGLPDAPPPARGESESEAAEPGSLDQPPVPMR